ncbi:MAG: glycosyltransferase family 2 protein [Chloroflexota bacterium]
MNTPDSPLDISIVMACLDEAGTIGICVAKARYWLAGSGLRGEVVVVDNGSTDGSPQIAAREGARVVLESARGYGRAYLRGFAEARGEIIVMGDSDDTYDFSDLSGLIAPLSQGADMVLGNRFSGGIKPGAMPFLHRYLGSPIINLILRVFFKVNVGDSQSGFRAFRRGLLDQLRLSSGGMELASEMIVRTAHGGFKIAEVPAPYSARSGKSKLNTVRDGWRHLRFLLVAAPDFLFIFPGLTLFVLGALVFLLSFISPAGVEIGSVSWQPIFAGTILVAIGANALVLGVVAKLHSVASGLLAEDGLVRVYRRLFSLESLLLLALLLVVAGLGIDLFLFIAYSSGGHVDLGLQLAALAQTVLIVGAQLGMAAFLMVTVETR